MMDAGRVWYSLGTLGAGITALVGAMRFWGRARRQHGESGAMALAVNLTVELARLTEFTGKVAAAITVCSAYVLRSDSRTRVRQREDLMWLSDCLHSFKMLGTYIARGSPEQIVHACDELIGMYNSYGATNPQQLTRARECFERNAQRFSLADGIAIFSDIRNKVLPLV